MSDSAWFDSDGKRGDVVATAMQLRDGMGRMRFRAANYVRVFHGELPIGTGVSSDSIYYRPSDALTSLYGRFQMNLLRSVLETAQSQIVRIPDITVLTNGASWKKHISAKKLSRFISGVFRASGLTENAGSVFLDGCQTPVGAFKFSVGKQGGINCERVVPHTLVWNARAGQKPRELYQINAVPRSALMARYPKYRSEIKNLPKHRPDAWEMLLPDVMADRAADLVDVTEGWHLGDAGRAGVATMACDAKLILESSPWDYDFFPIVEWKWSDDYNQYGGRPLAETIFGIHAAYNRMARSIDEDLARSGGTRVMNPIGSGVEMLSSLRAELVNYNPGMRPEIIPGVTPPPGYFAHLDRLERLAYASGGVNQATNEGTRPAGINSGVAIRAYQNMAASRLIEFGRRWELFFVRCAKVITALADDAYESASVRAMAPNTKLIEQIRWKDIDLKEDEIELTCEPISQMPNTLPGRLETIADLKGVLGDNLPAKRYIALLGMPDLDDFDDLESAKTLIIEKMVETALDDGEFIAPEPLLGEDGLKQLIDYATNKYLDTMLKYDDPPEENMELCRRLILRAKAMLPEPAAAPALPAMPPGLPGGAPGLPAGLPPIPGLPMGAA